MKRRNLQPGRPFFRGNLHTHTTVSDGRATPSEAARWYREHGYDFYAQTDHWRAVSEAPEEGILVIPGVEFDGQDPELGPYHIVGLDLRESPERGAFPTASAVTDYIREREGLAVLCHPYWCGMPSWSVRRVPGVVAVEVYNSTCEVHIAKGLSAVHLDDSLAAGARLWGLAVDDTHWGQDDSGGGWVMVQADDLTIPSLMRAIRAGSFYASGGPEILEFETDGKTAYARTSPASRIAFICDGHHGGCYRPDAGDSIQEAEFPCPEGVSYVRIEVDDERGKRAWANPLYLD